MGSMRCCFTLIKNELFNAIFSFQFLQTIYVLLIGMLCNQHSAVQDHGEPDILDNWINTGCCG